MLVTIKAQLTSSDTLWPPLSELLAPPRPHRVVVTVAGVVGVEELLEPLQELKVVLELCLDQLVHLHRLETWVSAIYCNSVSDALPGDRLYQITKTHFHSTDIRHFLFTNIHESQSGLIQC